MYNSYNTSNKSVNNKFKNNLWYNKAVGTYPITLPPLDFSNTDKYRKIYNNSPVKYDSYKLPPSLTHYPGSIARNPYLNPMFKFNYEPSEAIIKDIYSNTFEEIPLDDNSTDDELEYQSNQRDLIKKKSKNIESDTSSANIKLLRGDVVNIDKKTLVFNNYNSKTRRHVFKELTTLKLCDYDLTTRPYRIIIPSKLKFDIITPKNLIREIKYNDISEPSTTQKELSEGYLSDLENGHVRLDVINEVEDEDEKEFKIEPTLDIIENYVTIDEALESIYNIGKNIKEPTIIVHQDDTIEKDLEKTASKLVDDIIENVVTNLESEKTKSNEDDKSTIKEKDIPNVDLDEEENSNSWGAWCAIS
jgi:hypothetical protein